MCTFLKVRVSTHSANKMSSSTFETPASHEHICSFFERSPRPALTPNPFVILLFRGTSLTQTYERFFRAQETGISPKRKITEENSRGLSIIARSRITGQEDFDMWPYRV